jgi:hypothetical protein
LSWCQRKDKDRSDVKEDVVVDAAVTFSDKGSRGGNNNDNDYGGKGGNMDDVVGVATVLYVSEEEDGGSLIFAAPEGRITIGLMTKKTWWWILASRRMWWWMRPTLSLTRAKEEATTTATIMGAREAIWMMSLACWLYCMLWRKRMGRVRSPRCQREGQL